MIKKDIFFVKIKIQIFNFQFLYKTLLLFCREAEQ